MGKAMETSAAAEWARRVEEQEKSGLSIRKFAEQQGLKPGTLSFWKWKLARESSAAPAPHVAPLRFVELTAATPLSATPTGGAVFEVMLSSGKSVRVPVGFDGSELARLVAVLEGVRS